MRSVYIVPAHESEASRKWLPGLLRSYSANTHPHDAELLILAGGPESWAREIRESIDCAGVRVHTLGANLGFVGSVNAGIKLVDCDRVGILNTDVDLQSGWAEGLLECLDAMENVAACGYEGRIKENGFHIFVAFSCVLFRRAAIAGYDPLLDPLYGFGYYDDNDLCLRLLIDGWSLRVIDPPRMVHHGRGSAAPDFMPAIIENDMKFRRKWRDNPVAVGFMPELAVGGKI